MDKSENNTFSISTHNMIDLIKSGKINMTKSQIIYFFENIPFESKKISKGIYSTALSNRSVFFRLL
jgi:hypothetical protein